MSHYVEESSNLMHPRDTFHFQSRSIETKIQESKSSFCIDALLSKNSLEHPLSPTDTSRSVSPSNSTRSPSPPISPGSEEIPQNAGFVPRPGLLNHIYSAVSVPNGSGFYGYHHPHLQGQPGAGSAFHSLEGQKVQVATPHSQLHQMHLEWLARTGMFYPRLPDLTGELQLS
ncbi:hypothetical protein WA026_004945 [Henosepilachna vigintioctopunctata]|uniref:Uncharacterized protein n=1 Tax=Henosepilachna vigintioctopunctata TaxID=420089 RepID=A0AAW1USH9_9CUCU